MQTPPESANDQTYRPNENNPNETPSSYSIGLITQHDNEIHDNDIIMNTIADSGADIDVNVLG